MIALLAFVLGVAVGVACYRVGILAERRRVLAGLRVWEQYFEAQGWTEEAKAVGVFADELEGVQS